MKKWNVITAGAAVAFLAANSMLISFAFSDNTENVKAAPQKQIEVQQEAAAEKKAVSQGEAMAPQEEIDQVDKISRDTGTEYKIATCIAEDAVTKEEATELAQSALEEQFGVSLKGCEAMAILTVGENPRESLWFVTFASKDSVSGGSAPSGYVAFVDSETGEILSADKDQ